MANDVRQETTVKKRECYSISRDELNLLNRIRKELNAGRGISLLVEAGVNGSVSWRVVGKRENGRGRR